MHKAFCLGWSLLVANLLGSIADVLLTAPAPSPGPGECGDERSRLTLCFPGSPQNATCRYNLELNSTSEDLRPHSPQKACPQGFLFGESCKDFSGTIYFAFGPCNSDDVPEEQRQDNTKDVTEWINTLGLRTAEVLGGIFVRGYAYQQGFSLEGINLFPSLETLKPPQHLVLEGRQYTQVTFSGLATPALPAISSIPAGLSILDSPDVDFSNPQRFLSLTNVTNGISIAGCLNLKSLKGLEGLVGGTIVSNVQIIYNPILSDITALSNLMRCQAGGGTGLNPLLIVGTVAVHPLPLQPLNRGCTMNTPDNICEYIADSTRCPNGTEADVQNHGSAAQLFSGAPSPF